MLAFIEAPSIKVAEAAKVTENIQRDVNIALINEMHQLYTSIGINTMMLLKLHQQNGIL